MEQQTAVYDGYVQVADIQYQSESISNIAKALSEMQKTELFALTDSKNPVFNSKYANISSSWDAIRKPLTDNDLAITQITEPFPNGVTIVTILMHKSGEWFKGRSSWEVVKDKHGNRTPPSSLSLITYLRRAGVTAITGLCPEEEDGESLMDRETHFKVGEFTDLRIMLNQMIEMYGKDRFNEIFAQKLGALKIKLDKVDEQCG